MFFPLPLVYDIHLDIIKYITGKAADFAKQLFAGYIFPLHRTERRIIRFEPEALPDDVFGRCCHLAGIVASYGPVLDVCTQGVVDGSIGCGACCQAQGIRITFCIIRPGKAVEAFVALKEAYGVAHVIDVGYPAILLEYGNGIRIIDDAGAIDALPDCPRSECPRVFRSMVEEVQLFRQRVLMEVRYGVQEADICLVIALDSSEKVGSFLLQAFFRDIVHGASSFHSS